MAGVEEANISERVLVTGFSAVSCLKQFLWSTLPQSLQKQRGGREKGKAGSPCPGLPYLSDQPLLLSFRFLSLAWHQCRFPPCGLLEKVSSLAGRGPVLETGR